jgi:ATP-dependent Clp protease ATP-binding subunit ClpC
LTAHYGVEIGPEAVAAAQHFGTDEAMAMAAPGACVRLLDGACAMAAAEGRLSIDEDDVREAAPPREKDGEFGVEELRQLESAIGERVLGQSEAISAVVGRIRLTKLKLDRRPERPDGVFLLLGPSGVGKTELAKSIARALYGDLTRLVRLDMSEYMAEHEYSKVIGAPPGYKGHGEEGQLTGRIKRLEHAVILLDEIEKAHPSLLNLFLQVFDEGFLTDGLGTRVDFSRCIILMTSNMGRDLWEAKSRAVGFKTAVRPSEPTAHQVREHLLRSLPAEFINRVDALVPFRALEKPDLRRIAARLVEEEIDRWQRKGKWLIVENEVIEHVVDEGYDPRLGARHLERNLEQLVVQRLSDVICGEGWDAVDCLRVQMVDGAVSLLINDDGQL